MAEAAAEARARSPVDRPTSERRRSSALSRARISGVPASRASPVALASQPSPCSSMRQRPKLTALGSSPGSGRCRLRNEPPKEKLCRRRSQSRKSLNGARALYISGRVSASSITSRQPQLRPPVRVWIQASRWATSAGLRCLAASNRKPPPPDPPGCGCVGAAAGVLLAVAG